MPNEILTFDALASGVFGTDTGTPLNVGPGTVFRLVTFTVAAPPASVQYAGTVDTEGSLPASRKHENRQIGMTIICDTAAGLRSLQAKAAKLALEGGTIKWNLPNAEVGFYDIYATDTFEPTVDIAWQKNAGTYCTVSLSFTCAPYARSAEVDLGDNVETTKPVLFFKDTPTKGDIPGLGRLVVDNDQASAQAWMTWGIHARYFDTTSATTEEATGMFFEAEGCSLGSGVTATTRAGASGSPNSVARSTTLAVTLTEFIRVGSAAVGTSLKHRGTYRVYARVFAPNTNTGTVTLQARWSVNIGATSAVSNDSVDLAVAGVPVENAFTLVDLGLITPQKNPIETAHAYELGIYAMSSVLNDDLDIDYVMLIPADEGSGVSTAPVVATTGKLTIHDKGVGVSTGSVWGTDLTYQGDYLRVPTTESRTIQVGVKMARNTAAYSAPLIDDPGIDDISARLYYTPRYLVVPSP